MRKLEKYTCDLATIYYRLQTELREIERALSQTVGADGSEMRARAERIRQSISCLS